MEERFRQNKKLTPVITPDKRGATPILSNANIDAVRKPQDSEPLPNPEEQKDEKKQEQESEEEEEGEQEEEEGTIAHQWIAAVAKGAMTLYVKRIFEIPFLTVSGAKQLDTDIGISL